MKLSKIELKNYKRFEKFEVSINNSQSVFIGENNSGKTTIIKAIHDAVNLNNITVNHLHKYTQFKEEFENFIESEIDSKNPPDADNCPEIPTIEIKLEIIGKKSDMQIFSKLLNEIIEFIEEEEFNLSIVTTFKTTKPRFIDNYLNNDKQFNDELFKNSFEKSTIFTIAGQEIEGNSWKISEFINIDLVSIETGGSEYLHGTSSKTIISKTIGEIIKSLISNDDKIKGKYSKRLSETKNSIEEVFNEEFTNNFTHVLKQFGFEDGKSGAIGYNIDMDEYQNIGTRVRMHYDIDGIKIPETFNGLGYNNLLYILAKKFMFLKKLFGNENKKPINLFVCEEPEINMHPEMQRLFITRITNIVEIFAEVVCKDPKQIKEFTDLMDSVSQLLITTHSPEIISSVNYKNIIRLNKSRDLEISDDFNVKKYLSLNVASALMSKKVILIEGATERIILPSIINKMIYNQKINVHNYSIVEINGRHFDHFKIFLIILIQKYL